MMPGARASGWRRRLARAALVLLVPLLLMGVVNVPAWGAQPPQTPAALDRQPEIRLIEPDRDAPALQRIEEWRERLPEKYQHRNNFAWAVARIDGLEKTEYFAHSGIQSLGKISDEAAAPIAAISLRPKHGRFEILCVNHDDEIEGDNCWPRNVDTEYKIIEDMARRLPDTAVRGRVRLYTDLYPCASCRHVMGQFLAAYTNIQMQVLYRER